MGIITDTIVAVGSTIDRGTKTVGRRELLEAAALTGSKSRAQGEHETSEQMELRP